ncbi:MAG TPA: sulfotransferase [Gemmatimonadaceae bacterium]|nr:sulfotransferase [Gemmatimonadaceae bacterium]
MAADKVKVLYIAGNGRSGSTLLGVVLGQVPGFFNVGEVRRVWDEHNSEYDAQRGIEKICSCGVRFRDCPSWSSVFAEAFGGWDTVDRRALSTSSWKFSMHKRLLAPTMRQVAFPWEREELDVFLAALDRLYAAVPAATGSRLILDASKWPMYGAMVSMLPSVELYILHLVRDPRAVAFSFTRTKVKPGEIYIPPQSVLKTLGYWLAVNPAVERFWNSETNPRYMRTTYESFIRSPRATLERILSFVGEPGLALPLQGERTVSVLPSHSVAGNESRSARGDITLRLDDEWREKMPRHRRMLVESLAWPLLVRYGYEGRSSPVRAAETGELEAT